MCETTETRPQPHGRLSSVAAVADDSATATVRAIGMGMHGLRGSDVNKQEFKIHFRTVKDSSRTSINCYGIQ